MGISSWMAWEGGVDICGTTRVGLEAPNVILHVARVVHTPVGSAPSGMVLWQPDPAGSPSLAGFVSSSTEVGSWFGPHIFAGTPFEDAPCLEGRIEIQVDLPDGVGSRIEVGGHVFEVRLGKTDKPLTVRQRLLKVAAEEGVEIAVSKYGTGFLVGLMTPERRARRRGRRPAC